MINPNAYESIIGSRGIALKFTGRPIINAKKSKHIRRMHYSKSFSRHVFIFLNILCTNEQSERENTRQPLKKYSLINAIFSPFKIRI